MGKELKDVNIMRNTDEKVMEKNSRADKGLGRETAETEEIQAVEQSSLKEILESLGDEEFIVTVPIGREEEEHE